MTTRADVEKWLEISGALFRDAMPGNAGFEIFGHGLPDDEFVAIVDAEAAYVDDALLCMATAIDRDAARALVAGLRKPTLIALFSRWAHYQEVWETLLDNPAPGEWVPPHDVWRAIPLSMMGDVARREAARRSLWMESSEVARAIRQ